MNLQTGGINEHATQGRLEKTLLIRRPVLTDARAIWRLVRDSGVLDPNSAYCYLLLCDHFRETCRVAESDGRLVGFVTAYLMPGHSNSLFVWQIAIVPEFRGHGIAKKLLLDLLSGAACGKVNRLQATVAPSNTASLALFRAIAGQLQASMGVSTHLEADLFPGRKHEQEDLIAIGPFDPRLLAPAPAVVPNETHAEV